MADGDLPGADGGEGGQDICSFFSSFINQRQQIEGLLNWLRESQTACTDTNCFDDINGLHGSEHSGALAADSCDDYSESTFDDGPIAMVLCLIFGLLTIYAMSLNANRRTEEGPLPAKSNRSDRGDPNDGDNDDHGPFRRRGANGRDDDSRPAI